ncbi:MAG: hypothetical protein KBC57_02705 [Neisseriaceae bacterium]|nr:hypothetical protein [Neisseriaceae bacterium]
MKRCLVLIGIVLSGCVPIRVIPKYNSDIYLAPPVIQGYQKKETIGHTDPDQRWKDLQVCGVVDYNRGDLDLNASAPGESSKQVIARRENISACMKAKGYVIYSNLRCIKNKKPTGLCN